ncbi:MAG: C39 family peptidase [Alphaproteobacteria bacterium]|nr:C39 family peptidase [Alphaproteobacteria bacterium]
MARTYQKLGIGVACVAGLFLGHASFAADIALFTGGAQYRMPVVTLKEARFQTVVKQQYDFSCGSAAIATLLTYHYGQKVSERDVFTKMFSVGDQKAIRKNGFSMLDMKRYLQTLGYRADGFKVTLDTVNRVKMPAIVIISIRGYRHFVVVKGIKDDEVVVGDPAAGVKIYKRKELEKVMASDVIFLVRNRTQIAKKHFNADKDWSVRTKAPFGTALTRDGLTTFVSLLPGRNEF